MRTLTLACCLALSAAWGSTPKEDDDADWVVAPRKSAPEKASGEASSTAAAFPTDGPEEIWKASCAMCHGRDGTARTWLGKRNKVRDLTEPVWKSRVSVAEVKAAIRAGVSGTKMRGFEKKMSAAQLEALTQWVRAMAPPQLASSK